MRSQSPNSRKPDRDAQILSEYEKRVAHGEKEAVIKRQLAADFGLSLSRVRHIVIYEQRRRDLISTADPPTVPRTVVPKADLPVSETDRIAHLESLVDQLIATYPDRRFSKTPLVTPEFPDKVIPEPITFNSATAQIRQVQEFKRRHGVSQREATWIPRPQYPTLPIALTFFCDVHLGSVEVDYDLLDRYISLRSTPNMYAIFGGDYADGFSAVKIPSGMFSQALNPEEQWSAWSDLMYDMDEEHKVAAKSWGNHDKFMSLAGISPFSTFLRKASFPIFEQGGGKLIVRIGQQSYNIGLKHTNWGTSRLNITNAPKRALNYWRRDLDVMMLGHVHMAGAETFVMAGEEFIAIMGGTFKLMDTHYMEWSDDPHPPGFTVLLYPDEHHKQLCRFPDEAADILYGKIARLPHAKTVAGIA